MKKRLIFLISIVAIALIALIIFLVGGKSKGEEDIYQDFAGGLQEYLPDYTQDEIADIGRQELTEEQIELSNDIYDKFSSNDPSTIIDYDEDSGTITYANPDGTLSEETLDDEQKKIYAMGDEEAEAYTQQLLEAMHNDTLDEVYGDDTLTPEEEVTDGITGEEFSELLPPQEERRVSEDRIDLDMLEELQMQYPDMSEEEIKAVFGIMLHVPTEEELENAAAVYKANEGTQWGS